MKNLFIALFVVSAPILSQEKLPSARLYQLAKADLKAFAAEVSKGADSELGRSQLVVQWLAEHLEWKGTDYQKRTVQEIIDRGGGNCNELAMVAVAALKELNIPMRKVREINIHKLTPRRGETARQMVKEKGVQYSVFGRRHNDHVWLEIYDTKTGEWYPADPSIGTVGTKEWLHARVGFGKRFTLDPASEDMIVPFVIIAADETGAFTINRTQHYLVDEFVKLYPERLDASAAWKDWVRLLDELDDKAAGAFRGKVNLHDHDGLIDELANVYSALRLGHLKE